jgi:segregation and condensation protein A
MSFERQPADDGLVALVDGTDDDSGRYHVQTAVFEGPFDLLLHLILREQVDLYEVSITTIVDAYLTHLGRMEHLDLDVATEFLLIAATLIELKTRRLLPGRDDVDLDDELALWEERDLLLARLLECKTFKDAAQALQRMADAAERSFPRRAGMEERFLGLMPDVLAGIAPADLKAAFLRAVTPKPSPRVSLDHVGAVRLTVREAVDELLDELPRVGRISFRHLTQDLAERIEVIVRFLAVLELYKEGLIELEQLETFGEMTVSWLGDDGGPGGAQRNPLSIEEYSG